MFRSQVPPLGEDGRGAFLFIAHEMTQFSDNDVVVFSNCDSVRLTAFEGEKTLTLPVVHNPNGIPNAPVVFKGFWDFWQARNHSYTQRNWQSVSFVAEGIINGKVVCTEKKMPSRRSTKLRLYADEMGKKLVADGNDFIVVVAEVTDDNGNIRRLAKEQIQFTVEGEGTIIDDGNIMANPRATEWGSAPILVRSTHKAGTIRIIARPAYEGTYAPAADTLTVESIPYTLPMCYHEVAHRHAHANMERSQTGKTLSDAERKKTLDEVERQQQDFGIQ
jgi:beta-galactosidase